VLQGCYHYCRLSPHHDDGVFCVHPVITIVVVMVIIIKLVLMMMVMMVVSQGSYRSVSGM
jgi:hypothetical protein